MRERAKKCLRTLLGGGVLAALVAAAPSAKAWYFPEHTVLAHEGLMQLPPELREIIRSAVGAANREGLGICEALDVPLEKMATAKPLTTKMIRVSSSVDCVPYAATAALAGDHASSARELRSVLRTTKGIEIVSAAAFEWQRFQDSLDRLPNTPLERMSFVHALDVAFYFVDPGYEKRAQETRAHFADPSLSLGALLRAVEAGNIDNALGQFVTHHVRSLQLAARGELSESLLEHAFALHPRRVRRGSLDRNELGLKQRVTAPPPRLLRRARSRGRPRHERRAVLRARCRDARDVRARPVLGHQRRRSSQRIAGRLRSPARFARRREGAAPVRPSRSTPLARRRSSTRREKDKRSRSGSSRSRRRGGRCARTSGSACGRAQSGRGA